MEVSLTKMPKDTTLNITVRLTRRFRFRLWLGLLVIKIGTRILGATPEVQTMRLARFKCTRVIGGMPFDPLTVIGEATDDQSDPVQLLTKSSIVGQEWTGDLRRSIRLTVKFDACAIRKGDVFVVDGKNA